MATVLLGNLAPVAAPEGTTVTVNDEALPEREALEGKTIVLIDTPDHDLDGNPLPLDKQLTEVRNAFQVHSASQAAWVESHDDFFAETVSRIFACPVGRPDDWDPAEEPRETDTASKAPVQAEAVSQVEVAPEEVS